jgi:uncharacterized DUF497 family protein
MEFEWDDAKSDRCFEERGFDFVHAAQAFFAPQRRVRADARHLYGEDRYQLMGQIDGRVFVVVYTPRAHGVRIISARKANRREVQVYDDHTHDD